MNEELVLKLTMNKDAEMISLVGYIHKIGYGELTVKVRGGKPYQIVDMKKSILLTQTNKFGDLNEQ